jgi:hypothetical protein
MWMVAVLGLICSTIALASAPVGAQDPPTCNGRTATIWGDAGNNRIRGTDGPDVIWGGPGRDRIWGGGGADIICGGEGSDLIKGEKGRDMLFGDEGKDRVVGGQGADTIDGGRGNDRVSGGFGDDIITSGGGDDLVVGGGGVDSCDFDRNDAYVTCEEGDVAGLAGFGNTVFSVDVPDDFIANSYTVDGITTNAYVLDMYVATGNNGFREMNISVLDSFGRVMFSSDPVADVYSERVLILGDDIATISVGGLIENDFWDIAFVTHRNLPRFDPDRTIVLSNGSAVFKWNPAIAPGSMGEINLSPQFVGTNVTLFTMAPGQPGQVELEILGLEEDRVLTGEAVAGATLYAMRAWKTDWDITITSPG